MSICRFFLVFSICLVGCGRVDMHQVHENLCSQELIQISVLKFEIDVAHELIKENNQEWQKLYDDKVCYCDVQNMSYDVQ